VHTDTQRHDLMPCCANKASTKVMKQSKNVDILKVIIFEQVLYVITQDLLMLTA